MNKIEELIKLKEERRDIWIKHEWSCKYFTKEEKMKDSELREKEWALESEGAYCKCTSCGEENDTVDFNSESPDKIMCLECWDELRDEIRSFNGI